MVITALSQIYNEDNFRVKVEDIPEEFINVIKEFVSDNGYDYYFDDSDNIKDIMEIDMNVKDNEFDIVYFFDEYESICYISDDNAETIDDYEILETCENFASKYADEIAYIYEQLENDEKTEWGDDEIINNPLVKNFNKKLSNDIRIEKSTKEFSKADTLIKN